MKIEVGKKYKLNDIKGNPTAPAVWMDITHRIGDWFLGVLNTEAGLCLTGAFSEDGKAHLANDALLMGGLRLPDKSVKQLAQEVKECGREADIAITKTRMFHEQKVELDKAINENEEAKRVLVHKLNALDIELKVAKRREQNQQILSSCCWW